MRRKEEKKNNLGKLQKWCLGLKNSLWIYGKLFKN